jgi:hypothetical protein
MAEFGYPMPEDVIAAEKLTNADLRNLAEQGNDKAGFLLRERNIAETKARLDEFRAAGKSDADFWSNDPVGQQLAADDETTRDLLRKSQSPYKGYVKALGAEREDEQLGKDADIIAGLEWAQRLGDFRAGQFLRSYVDGNPTREAMFTSAAAVSTDLGNDLIDMMINGCAKPGVPAGMSIPGNVTPVE